MGIRMALQADPALRQVPLFADLSERQLRKLADKFSRRYFEPGAVVVEQGKMSGIGFFIISDGAATVSDRGKEIGRLGPGDHFGELALIAHRERTATVTAETRLECLELPTWDFKEFVTSDGDVAWKLLQHAANVLLDTDTG